MIGPSSFGKAGFLPSDSAAVDDPVVVVASTVAATTGATRSSAVCTEPAGRFSGAGIALASARVSAGRRVVAADVVEPMAASVCGTACVAVAG